jgi:hypothetical protein
LLASEAVTTLPSRVDGTVRSIAHTYDNLNRPQNITSYASPGGTGTIVNDIQYAYYDGMNKVATSYLEHDGAVNTSTTLNVQYTDDTTTMGSIYSNQLRVQTDVHPNGRSIYYDYGSSSPSTAAYSATSTVREIWDGSRPGPDWLFMTTIAPARGWQSQRTRSSHSCSITLRGRPGRMPA